MKTTETRLPPGPPNLVTALGGWLHNPFRFLRGSAERYGDCFTLPRMGDLHYVVFSNPEHIREIFAAPPDVLCAGAAGEPLRWMFGPHSLFLLRGDQHATERRQQSPSFSPQAIRRYGRGIQDAVRGAMAEWRPGTRFALYPYLQQITTDVMLEAMLGVRTLAQRRRYRPLIAGINRALGGMLAFVPALQRDLGPWSPWVRFHRTRDALHALLRQEFAQRRATPEIPRADVLSLLMGVRDESGAPYTDAHLCDTVTTSLMAGQETTGKALAWAFGCALRRPDIVDRVRAELAPLGPDPDPEAVAELPYLGALVNEALRFSSVVPFTVRSAVQPADIGGYRIRPGMTLLVCAYLTHRRADVFPNPDEFQPERFLERKYTPYQFFPFGGGVRKCIGSYLATFEMKLVIATILARTELRPGSNRPPEPVLGGITVGTKGGTEVVLQAWRGPPP